MFIYPHILDAVFLGGMWNIHHVSMSYTQKRFSTCAHVLVIYFQTSCRVSRGIVSSFFFRGTIHIDFACLIENQIQNSNGTKNLRAAKTGNIFITIFVFHYFDLDIYFTPMSIFVNNRQQKHFSHSFHLFSHSLIFLIVRI